MSPVTRLAWWWLRTRGWAIQVNDDRACDSDPVRGWRPLFSIRYGQTPVYRVGPNRVDRAARHRWASLAARSSTSGGES